MSPPRRRSARLASATPRGKAAPELSSVAERDETPRREANRHDANPTSPMTGPCTPASSALKPPRSEMHPSKYQATTAAPSSALRLGFTDIKPTRHGEYSHLGALATTPSKIGGVPSASFDFRVAQDAAAAGLSSNAQRMMEEIREQAARVKADLVAQREAEGESGNIHDRMFATPKGKTRRFSAAHMAEFKKMDSIENHPSAWRAQNGKFTPVKSSLKRSPSKANLDGTPTSLHKSVQAVSPSKAGLGDTPTQRLKQGLKRTSSVANLDNSYRASPAKRTEPTASPSKPCPPPKDDQSAPAKRFKKRQEDDASTTRPQSFIAPPLFRTKSNASGTGTLAHSQSSLARLMSHTKSSKAPSAETDKPTISLVPSPSKPNFGSLTQSATMQNLASPSRTAELKRRIISPGRFQKVKSILRGHKTDSDSARTAIPLPAAQVLQTSQTPGPRRIEKELPPLPLTTPRRKLTKHVAFTPETNPGAADVQDSPSPKKGGLFRSLSRSHGRPQYPGLDGVLAQSKTGDVVYPDLSGLQHLVEPVTRDVKARVPSAPGKFTFRSDHTIQFGAGPAAGFGASPGQSSVRQVRGSMMPSTDMPGSFPAPPSPSVHPNKENKEPSPVKVLLGAAHGITNKKRSRASSDEQDAEREAEERATKKRKNEHVPGGQQLLGARSISATPKSTSKLSRPGRFANQSPSKTPSRTPGRTPVRAPSSASPTKKSNMMSLSRLNMLARPKNRT